MRALVYIFLILLVFRVGAAPISRILKADSTLDDDVAGSIAVITNKKGDFFCTATVLNEMWLLTGAHCNFRKKSKIRVGRLKNDGWEDTTVRKFLKHPDYDKDSGLHDIALVKVKKPLHSFYPVRLYLGEKYLKKHRAIAAGYGRSEKTSNELNQKDLTIISLKKCKKAMEKKDYRIPPDWNKRNFVCAGKNSVTCFGDSGGPLFVLNRAGYLVQVGVLLGGRECKDKRSGKISPKKGVPNVYTAVSGHAEWIIKSVTGTIRVVGNVRKGKRRRQKNKTWELEAHEVW